jgi:predicted Rossmann fold flavoprotein
VTKTLEKACKSVGVDVRLNEKVLYFKHTMPDIIPMPGIGDSTSQDIIPTSGILLLKTEKGEYFCDNIIVATGGVSYPSTGSTGDGYTFAKTIGHTVTPLYSGLCGVNLSNDGLADLQGLALKNVQITAKQGSKTVFNDFGELLFTHFGVSGPIVLSMSSKINRLPLQNLSVTLDLKPALDENTLDKRILRDFETFNNKQIGNALNALLPQKLIPFVLKYCNIPLQKNVSIITKEERTRLCKTMKALPLYVESLRGFNEAIITSGGIALSEINPKTMESKKMAGVKFCGEVLDVDAFTGGFNMQIAFSTGYAAGITVK